MKTKKSGPTPFSYNPKPFKSRRSLFNSKLERSGFIEDAKARANDSPPPYDSKYTYVKPRLKGSAFLPTKKDSLEPIKKSKDPDCGTYDTKNGYEKTVKRVKASDISKYNLPKIQDLRVKQKKFVPGVGHYDWAKSFERTTRPPLFKKGKY